jgi:RNA polymerase sigma-70 factor (ECF subfamily)
MAFEEQVRALIAAGDSRAAAEEAIRTLGPRILGYLRAVLRDEGDAGEAFSAFAERMWRGIDSFRGDASFRTWAFKIAWNSAIDVRQEAWRRLGRPFASGEASALADEIRTATPVRVERRRDALSVLRESLTPEEQTLLTLRIDQGLSWDEVAEVLGVTAPLLRQRFKRLKDRLAALARANGLVE